jgi:transposase InsO family protein
MKDEHSLATLCAAFGVSQADCHRWKDAEPATRAREAARLCEAILVVHGEHRSVHDNPRVQRELPKHGRRHGRKRIARLMRAASLRGKCPRRFVPCITQSRRTEPIAPNRLAEQLQPTVPNQVWVSDIAHVRTGEGWLYVAAIMDLHNRRIVGWATGAGLAADLVLTALAMALRHRRPSCSTAAIAACSMPAAASVPLIETRLITSTNRKANLYDNAASSTASKPSTTICASAVPSAINPLWTLKPSSTNTPHPPSRVSTKPRQA